MADILIRKVDKAVKQKLAASADRAGKSLEAFIRAMLEEKAAASPASNDEQIPFSEWIRSLFADIDPKARDEFAATLENLPYERDEIEDPFSSLNVDDASK